MKKLWALGLIAASCAFAQGVTVGTAVFAGSGLNDATSGGPFLSFPANAVYVATISATGTPDHFKWTKNGGAASSPVAIVSGAIALSDGVTIAFGATTGHTLADAWTINARAHGSIEGASFVQAGVGAAITRPVEAKLRDTYSALDFSGVDPTGATDSTAGLQACIAAAGFHQCYAPAGFYQISNPSGYGALTFSADGQGLRGDGLLNTVLIQETNLGTSLAIKAADVHISDLQIVKAAGVTRGTAISIYPDVSRSQYAKFAKIDDVGIYAAYCPENSPTLIACATAANSNRLDYGILVQSGTLDSLFHRFTHLKIRWAGDGIRLMSGGFAGSSGPGAAQAVWMVHDWISDVTNCLHFTSSGENFFPALQCTNASNVDFLFDANTAGTYDGFPSGGAVGEVVGEASAATVDFGNAASYAHGNCPQSNIITEVQNEIDASLQGNFIVFGDCQYANEINIPGIKKSGFYSNIGVISGTYTSGGTIVGLMGGACFLTFPGGGTATVAITGTNVIAGGTILNIETTGTEATAPTTAVLSNSSGGVCSGTATVATVIKNTSKDSFFCAGIIDDYNSRCTATIDFRATPNISNYLRFRSGANITSTTLDYLNCDKLLGCVFQPDTTFGPTTPVITLLNRSAGGGPNPNLLFGTGNVGAPLWGGRLFSQYWNSSSSTAMMGGVSGFSGSLGSQTEVYPFLGVANGLFGPNIELTVAAVTVGFTCNTTLLIPSSGGGGTANADMAVYDLLSPVIGAAPTGGGAIHGHLHCNGANWVVGEGGGVGSIAANAITALTGDGTATGPGSVGLTLATVNTNTGSFGDSTHVAQVTLNAKGLATAASAVAIALPLTGTTGSIGGGALLAGACASGTAAVTGSTTSMAAIASPAGGVDPTNAGVLGVSIDAFVLVNGTVTVRVCPPIAGTPAAATYNVRVVQ